MVVAMRESATLTGEVVETITLVEAEAVIERGMKNFVEVGNALAAIHDGGMYKGRDEYPDFDTYCKVRWGFTKRYHNYQIAGARTVNTLMGTICSHLPESEGQARPLAKLLDQPEVLVKVWEGVVKEAEATGQRITERKVRAAVAAVVPPPPPKPKKPRPMTKEQARAAKATPLEQLQFYFTVASHKERAQFREWLKETRDNHR